MKLLVYRTIDEYLKEKSEPLPRNAAGALPFGLKFHRLSPKKNEMARKAKTYVYFNLHKHVWSVMFRGLVQRHAESVTIIDADFVVRAAGHAKVLREKKKNVHAFVRGTESRNVPTCSDGIQLSYNPYKGPYFYRKDTGEVVASARVVELRADRTLWAWGVTGSSFNVSGR